MHQFYGQQKFGLKPKETDRNQQKRTEIERNGQKRTDTDRNGRTQTDTDSLVKFSRV